MTTDITTFKPGSTGRTVTVSDLRKKVSAYTAEAPIQQGVTFLKVDDRTGEATIGIEKEPLNPHDVWTVSLDEVLHGYLIFPGNGEAPNKTYMKPILETPLKPVPPNGIYAKYPDPGPADAMEIVMHPVPGMNGFGKPVTFSAPGKSAQNRIRSMISKIEQQLMTGEGEAGFVFPIFTAFVNSYYLSSHKRDVHHWDFNMLDWLATGKGLLSENIKTVKAEPKGFEAAAAEAPTDATDVPWEEDDNGDSMFE